MAIEHWDPFREAVSLREAMNALLQESYVRPGTAGAVQGAFPLDVSESENEYIIHALLPGIKPDDIHITVHGETVTIRGESKAEEEQKKQNWLLRERRFGSFARSLSLGAPIDADRASTKFEHGVLTLTLPKAEHAKPKQIRIGGGTAEASPVQKPATKT